MKPLHLRSLTLSGFTVHDNTKLRLPERGLVVVCGGNGSGKSSLVEAVAWALWGKTLRGTDPVTPGQRCSVVVDADSLVLCRSRKDGGRAKVTADIDGVATEWDSAAKARESIESTVGSLQAWRRTAVFSSQDASRFTEATDGERKRFIEDLLGLHRFDAALKHCRADLAAAKNAAAKADSALSICRVRQEEATRRATEARATLSSLVNEEGDPTKKELLERLRPMVAQADDDVLAARTAMQTTPTVVSLRNSRMTYQLSHDRLESVNGAECPTCSQPISEQLRRDMMRDLSMLGEKIAKLEVDHRREKAVQQRDTAELEREAGDLRKRLVALERHEAAVARAEHYKARATAALAEAEEEAHQRHERLTALQAEADAAAHPLDALKAAEGVLGLKGVRTQVISKALGGIESVANAWLARIAGTGLELCLGADVESGTISLEVLGAGGGRGYRGASGGERRRLDVALLLALAEAGAAAHGASPGTLFFDEVFDTLDADGVSAVARALHDLAADRAVVVITHSATLADQLKAAVAWSVQDGTVTVS